MGTTNVMILFIIVVTCIGYIIISKFVAGKYQHPSDFLLYRKSLDSSKMFGTLYASGMSLATVFISFFLLAPYFGISLIWAALFYCLGYIVLYLFLDKIFDSVKDGKTIHGFLGNAYQDKKIKNITSIVTTIGFMGIFSTEILVGSNILKDILPAGIDPLYPIILFAIVVIVYSLLGGLKSVIITDLYQAAGTIIAIFLVLIVAIKLGKQDGVYFQGSPFKSIWLSPLMMLNFFLINVPFPLVDMATWQRIAAVKKKKGAKKGVIITIAVFLISWLVILFSALLLTEYSSMDHSGGLTYSLIKFAKSYGIYGVITVLIVFPSLVAAMLSTADSYLVASAQTIIMDVKDHDYFDKHSIVPSKEDFDRFDLNPDDRKVVMDTRYFMFIGGIIGISLVILLEKIGFKVDDLVFAVYGSSLSLVPSTIIALIKKDNIKYLSPAAIVSIVSGTFFGWVYGILSVLLSTYPHNSFLQNFAEIDLLPGKPSAHNSPTIAFFVSLITFAVSFLVIRMRRKK